MWKKTFLVTGGAGFIGSHLCDFLLSQQCLVICVDNFCDFYSPKIKEENIRESKSHPNFSLHRVDIRDKDALNTLFVENQIDLVIHLAGMAGVRASIEKPLLYEEVNVRGTLTLLECMREHAVQKLVFASSSSVYGSNKGVPFRETDNVDHAISPYASSKKASEVQCHVYHHLFGIDVALLRFFTVFGPRQRPDLAIHKFTKGILEGEPIQIFGDGSSERDYTYVDDVVEGIWRSINFVLENEQVYEVFNIGNSQTVSLKKMVATLEGLLKREANIQHLPMQAGDMVRTFADISKAKEMLGYHPQTSFEDGIREFLMWYQEVAQGGILQSR